MARLAPVAGPVRRALDTVDIVTACRLIGMDLPADPGYGKSIKVRCPFGNVYHSDGGAEAAMRVYPDEDRVFCFAKCGGYTTVSLAAAAWGLPIREAAIELLERAGVPAPDPAALWDAACTRETPPDTTLLAEALKTFCARICPDWAHRQFQPDTANLLGRCLALLDLVATSADADRWLARCKHVMTRHLDGHH